MELRSRAWHPKISLVHTHNACALVQVPACSGQAEDPQVAQLEQKLGHDVRFACVIAW